ncbi:MAG: hypothetical protein KJ904_18830 [Alphaproteobacteria bacterium]|nr:hypothetical protein [Alphaproteobacteria bacterium]MBU0797474.1 hypothetical protein [Alphaproteobacteria bacterium]MBU0889217.1 hypothetical protein [Alphaproteobacteria bacterium]MBU1813806.1 hypothetical protein [Alphaproteobacteria bacterium]
MPEIKPFDPLWEEENILICVTLPAPLGKTGCYTVMNWCQKGSGKLEVKRVADQLMASREEALAAAGQFCDQNAIPILYDADFHAEDFSRLGQEIEAAMGAAQGKA